MAGGLVTMDGSTIANCSGTASSDVHSSRVVGSLGRSLVCGWVWWVGRCFWVGVKGEVDVCVCVCVCDMGVDCMVSHMCLLIARGADIPGAMLRAHSTQREACMWMAAR